MKKEVIKQGGLVPHLRFPEFKEEWEKTKIGNVGDVKMCKRIFAEQTLPIGDVPFYKIGSFGKKADAYISKQLYTEFREKYSFPKKGDILISASGTIGRTVVYNGEDAYYQDSNIVWIDINTEKITNSFLYYIYQIVTYKTEGGTIQRLYNNILKATEFYTTTLPEQTKIADFLTQVDTQISLLADKVAQLQLYKKGVMQKLFSQELRFKDEDGKDYPEWEEKKLGEVCSSISSGRSKKSDITNSYVLYGSTGYIGYCNENIYSGDKILIARVGANAGYLYKVKGEYGVTDNTLIIDLKKHIDIDFIFYNLLIFNINKLVFGTGQPLITGQLLKKIKINLPSLPEQTKIANFLTAIDEQITGVEEQLAQSREFKKGLLQGMFV